MDSHPADRTAMPPQGAGGGGVGGGSATTVGAPAAPPTVPTTSSPPFSRTSPSSADVSSRTALPVAAPAGPAESASLKKRNRIRLSCTTCREKKLKCNRALPCDQCEKRNIENTCVYVPYLYPRNPVRIPAASRATAAAASAPSPAGGSNRPSPAPSGQSLQDRVRQLEELVQSLRGELNRRAGLPGIAEEGGPSVPTTSPNPLPTPTATSASGSTPSRRGALDTPGDLSGVTEPTPAGPIADGLRYVDAANWEAISDDVTKLLNELRTTDDEEEDGDGELDQLHLQQGPALILGSFPHATVMDLVNYLPEPQITDQLVERFFQGKEPAWLMFHIPSFWRQYRAFWDAPETYSITWVGLLCIMIAHSALFCLRGDEEVPGNLGSAQEVFDLYRIRSAQCLCLDDYTKPGKWKVEALLLYFGTEYLRVRDAQRGTSIILSITVRLAMHMGLHRDPTHYREISTFECQMRRRLWTLLTEIDVLVSFQFGLPANIQSAYFDTKLPANLNDEDFDENTIELPPDRPLTERTASLYTIVKSRIVVAMGNIVARMASKESPTYGEVMRLDRQLEDAHDAIPPVLRARRFSMSMNDPVDLIMQRLWIELMYQKARIVLHRRYFTLGRSDYRFAPSTSACMKAATATLEHQFEVHNEIHGNGRLSKERWFLSSLSTHDFLLADMIICLEISCILQSVKEPGSIGAPVPQQEQLDQLLHIIRTSRSVWGYMRNESEEANRAFKILGRMIGVSTGALYGDGPESHLDNVDLHRPPSYHFTGTTPTPPPVSPSGATLGVRGTFGTTLPSMQSFQQQHHLGAVAGAPGWNVANVQSTGMNVGMGGPSQWAMPQVDMGMTHLEDVVDQDMGVDWSSWDVQIQNRDDAETLQIPWTNFFARPGGL